MLQKNLCSLSSLQLFFIMMISLFIVGFTIVHIYPHSTAFSNLILVTFSSIASIAAVWGIFKDGEERQQ